VEAPLEKGDRIVAVDGIPATHSSDILKAIQGRKSQVIVERPSQKISLVTWQNADALFDAQTHAADIDKIAATIGSGKPLEAQGSLQLLKPAALKTYREIFLESEQPGLIGEELIKQRRAIEGLEDPQQRAQLLQALEERESQYALGVPFLRDLKVQYNPVPTDQFMQVFNEIARTVKALFTGSLSPKWLSGPVGIVYMFQEQTRSSLSDGLYWLGLISLNLGVLNLLPIPMLDGGTIVLSLLEWITGKRIPPKTLEKLILPFAILLIILFLYWTYNDISRIFGGFLRK
jgi:regulator of sigma E protease